MATAQVDTIPEGHTAAILRSNGTVYASGSMKEMNHKWEILPFTVDCRDIYTLALLAIDDKWYRASWLQC